MWYGGFVTALIYFEWLNQNLGVGELQYGVLLHGKLRETENDSVKDENIRKNNNLP